MSETLSDILHPEIVLGRRGSKRHLESYSQMMSDDFCKYIPDVGWSSVMSPSVNEPLSHHVCIAKKFKMERPPIYRLGKDFAEVLAGVSSDIPMDKLPERFFGYISIPKGVVLDDTGSVFGAYVFIGDAKETSATQKLWGTRCLWLSAIGDNFNPSVEDDFSVQHILMPIMGTFEETFKSLPFLDVNIPGLFLDMSKKAVKQRMEAIRCIVNAVLYINSLEPNIDHLKPANNLTHGQRKKLRASGKNINMCTVPVVAVNWAYKREREYSVDETYRREHHRWQRCGPGLSEIKLTLVKGHIVKFKRGENEEVSQAED